MTSWNPERLALFSRTSNGSRGLEQHRGVVTRIQALPKGTGGTSDGGAGPSAVQGRSEPGQPQDEVACPDGQHERHRQVPAGCTPVGEDQGGRGEGTACHDGRFRFPSALELS